jgi:selenophosphate synthetase-related protein
MDAIEDVLDAQIDEPEDLEATFEEFEVDVPLRYGDDAPFARWGLDGTVRVSVDGMRGGLAEWLEYWSEHEE